MCFATTNPHFCVDVGANVGRYSEFLLAHTSSLIFAFEPLPAAFERLKNLKEKYRNRFVIENMGCAEKSGTLDLHFGSELSQLASFSTEVLGIHYVRKENINTIKVQTISLDDYFLSSHSNFPKRCDLLKIDTEGYESEVLSGAKEFIQLFQPRVIQLELNLHHLFRGHSLKSIIQNLSDYSLFRLLPFRSGMVECDIDDFSSKIFQYSNYILIASDAWSDSDFRDKFKV